MTLSLRVYSHSLGQNAFHMIFRTKYNIKFFSKGVCNEAASHFLLEAAKNHKMGVYTIKVMPDHVHLFLELPSPMSPALAAQLLKGYSSRRFFLRFSGWKRVCSIGHDGPHLWSRWRFSRSVGDVNAGVIENYIRNSEHNQFSILQAGGDRVSGQNTLAL